MSLEWSDWPGMHATVGQSGEIVASAMRGEAWVAGPEAQLCSPGVHLGSRRGAILQLDQCGRQHAWQPLDREAVHSRCGRSMQDADRQTPGGCGWPAGGTSGADHRDDDPLEPLAGLAVDHARGVQLGERLVAVAAGLVAGEVAGAGPLEDRDDLLDVAVVGTSPLR